MCQVENTDVVLLGQKCTFLTSFKIYMVQLAVDSICCFFWFIDLFCFHKVYFWTITSSSFVVTLRESGFWIKEVLFKKRYNRTNNGHAVNIKGFSGKSSSIASSFSEILPEAIMMFYLNGKSQICKCFTKRWVTR